MADAVFVETATVPGSPDSVRAWYCDITNLRQVHPLIIDVSRTGHSVDAAGTTVSDFAVRERVLVAGLPVRTTYRVTITAPTQGPVRTLARQFPRVRLDGEVTFTAAEGGTVIHERVTVHAPRPLLRFVAREGQRAHVEMFARMAARFATDPV